ncbi:MAG: hypothetical protein LLG06_01785 [Desulfobacteraceae bacterium]|nr:hypothetical protein [Desulfobacteraceae bacterium]
MTEYDKTCRKMLKIMLFEDGGRDVPDPRQVVYYCAETGTIYMTMGFEQLRAIQLAKNAGKSYLIADGEVYVDADYYEEEFKKARAWSKELEESFAVMKERVKQEMESTANASGIAGV